MISVISTAISVSDLKKEADTVFGDMVKAVVDVQLEIMAINGELHADEEALLMQQGSAQSNLWGINLYPDMFGTKEWLEFDSMINLRPSGGNRTRGVDDVKTQQRIIKVVEKLVQKDQ